MKTYTTDPEALQLCETEALCRATEGAERIGIKDVIETVRREHKITINNSQSTEIADYLCTKHAHLDELIERRGRSKKKREQAPTVGVTKIVPIRARYTLGLACTSTAQATAPASASRRTVTVMAPDEITMTMFEQMVTQPPDAIQPHPDVAVLSRVLDGRKLKIVSVQLVSESGSTALVEMDVLRSLIEKAAA